MTVHAINVAQYFLTLADPEMGDSLSNLKLQKLVYYAQGFHLAIYGEPLFEEPIEAWKHGPVVPDLYHALKFYGAATVPPPEYAPDIPDNAAGLIQEVWTAYGQFSAWKLADLTHVESPWQDAWAKHERGEDNTISHDALASYFMTQLEP